MKLYSVKLYFKNSKTKWASCSASNKISFNPEVMKLSSSLIKYVVIHELAHIQYKNHSKDFLDMSDYQEKEETLRDLKRSCKYHAIKKGFSIKMIKWICE